MASPNLPSLPTELIQEITRHLAACSPPSSPCDSSPSPHDGLLSLRQTCRQLHAKTHHPFLDRHFAHRRHLFTEHSLKALVALSSSTYPAITPDTNPNPNPDLAPAVRTLTLSLLPFEHTRDRNAALHDPTSALHVPCPYRRAALAVFLAAQARGRRAGADVALLASALRRLPRLRCLRLRANDPTACWGYRKLGRDLGWPAYMQVGAGGGGAGGGGAILPGTYAFETTLVAVAEAAAGEGDGGGGGAAVPALRELDVEGGLPPSALVLDDRDLVERLRAPLAHVRVLTLFVSLPLRTVVIGGPDHQPAAGAAAATAATGAGVISSADSMGRVPGSSTHFLSLLPNLEVLRLGAARGRTSNLDHFLAEVFSISSTCAVDDVIGSTLKALHLLRLDCRRADVLGPVLRRCPALEYLVLEDGAARASCWRPAMRYAAEGRHPSLVGVLCKRFEVLPDDEDDEEGGDGEDGDGDGTDGGSLVGEGLMTAGGGGGELDGGSWSPFLEYEDGGEAGGAARHLVVDRDDGMDDDTRSGLGERLPWWVFSTKEFWEKERVLFQIR
ncbi:f-box domain cyclin-like protein [Diplodia corticola]|uniref:F-box domain cyclin-like protein n=1 Tax=Diplodia corticola TaxID=236234 RepID=A0A1J9QJN0_9PEZI|nr:f-box domain cyclin-like protein [Diplodia corticola]OJD29078.1 f-box domain cyclin-like protein [Diplodia corticola]